ncbi:MurR/RpiR family transcriptional regulator [Staphylococcus durrellii]|uniref:MurR/RpiR family transcriptional regulator n=1 Tax=Staphylococcus durrellii TaxID=2781773 RepID=UPI00189EBFA4|nr:MurR/RpiR family transcriptional regulator [Staphylococcus durrellii]MBF7017780.1 MurR/RpiR family transcriptional regulator [Staphylococcus durrellii]
MLLDHLINQYYDDLNDNDLHIINIMHNNVSKLPNMKIQDLSLLTHTSISTIHRLVKKLGFEGYSDFKFYTKLKSQDNSNQVVQAHSIIEDVERTIEHLDMLDYDVLNALIDNAPLIYIFGTGMAQQNVARDAQRHLLSISKKVILLNDENELIMAIDQMTRDDLLFIISLSGETQHISQPIHILKSRQLNYVSITTLHDNFIAQNAKFNIYVSSTPLQFFNNIQYHSFTPYYVIFDYIVRTYHNYKIAQKNKD